MRKKRFIILLVSFLCLFFIIVYAGNERNEYRKIQKLGVSFVSGNDFLEGKTKLETVENPGVLFEQVLLPYDANTNRLFLAQCKEAEVWEGALSSGLEGYELYAQEDSYWDNIKGAMRDNHLFKIWLISEQNYYELQLVISGMPVLSMNTQSVTQPEEVIYEEDPDKWAFGSEIRYNGTMMLFNPSVQTEQYEIVQTGVIFHHKGASTGRFDKKGYDLNLTDSKGANLDVALLGMRSDDDWKLNALYTDVSRIREITASQIWEKFDEADLSINEPGPRMEYVELILDNDYKGLYCLVEPVDAKKVELDRNDSLYKVIGWEPPLVEDIQISVDNKWKVQGSVRVRYPKEINDYVAAWYPMKDYLQTFYFSEKLDAERAKSIVSIENLSDMLMFTMVISASDNSFKNTYYAAKVIVDDKYEMLQIPWDLDYTFGNVYGHNEQNAVRFESDYTIVYEEISLPRLKTADSNIGPFFWERWLTYRKSFLSTDVIIDMFEENRSYIIQTGAIEREKERWPEAGVDTDIVQLIEYQQNRMSWLDKYFEEWVQ